jgi:hypothetical protein
MKKQYTWWLIAIILAALIPLGLWATWVYLHSPEARYPFLRRFKDVTPAEWAAIAREAEADLARQPEGWVDKAHWPVQVQKWDFRVAYKTPNFIRVSEPVRTDAIVALDFSLNEKDPTKVEWMAVSWPHEDEFPWRVKDGHRLVYGQFPETP